MLFCKVYFRPLKLCLNASTLTASFKHYEARTPNMCTISWLNIVKSWDLLRFLSARYKQLLILIRRQIKACLHNREVKTAGQPESTLIAVRKEEFSELLIFLSCRALLLWAWREVFKVSIFSAPVLLTSWNIKHLKRCGIISVGLLTLQKLCPAEIRKSPSLFNPSPIPCVIVGYWMLTMPSSRCQAQSEGSEGSCSPELHLSLSLTMSPAVGRYSQEGWMMDCCSKCDSH